VKRAASLANRVGLLPLPVTNLAKMSLRSSGSIWNVAPLHNVLCLAAAVVAVAAAAAAAAGAVLDALLLL
jgi:hypothetical protein